MNAGQILELVSAVLIMGAGIYLMRRRLSDGSRKGSQGGIILVVIGAMIAVHAFGLLEYRPSPAELEAMQQ
jgi:hypothetical protein